MKMLDIVRQCNICYIVITTVKNSCGKQLYWFGNLSLFQVETIVQIGCLTAVVMEDVFPQKKSSIQC